jgi:L-gulono-1,4-lactone dehydrogenase
MWSTEASVEPQPTGNNRWAFQPVEQVMIQNFGGNVSFEPEHQYSPRSEAEVLEILARHRGQRIKVIGRLHSWSEAPRGDEVLLDLRHLNRVDTEQRKDRVWVRAGAGCQIKKLLVDLEQQGLTTPSLGLITEQAIAGAISTGTHGSGRHSLSHYMDEVRVAIYDPVTGEPIIRTINEGPELRAARCSLGSMGVILSVGFWARPLYHIEECIARHATLEHVLQAEDRSPLQQFYLVPWAWNYLGQHRREVDAPRSSLAWLYGMYCFLTFDIGMHLAILFMERLLRSRRVIQTFFRHILPWTVIRGWKTVDKAQNLLIMEHELFRHIEIEVFVKRSVLPEALTFTQELLRHFGGEKDALTADTRKRLSSPSLLAEVDAGFNVFTYNYLICVRKVLPDDTFISMASSDDEPYYALSFVSYAHPTERSGYIQFASCLTNCMVALFGGRPHWGKYCPLTPQQAAEVYPHLPEFRAVCQSLDPQRVFRNDWINRTVFDESPR